MHEHEMPFRPMGKTGLKLSALGLGSWITYGGQVRDLAAIKQIYSAAYAGGIRFFDTASSYSQGEAERMMGLALRDFPRRNLVLSSKACLPVSDDPNDRGLSRKHIMEAVEQTLRHLGTDYLDLFFCHRFDPHTPREETLRALDDLLHQGKILYWGTSQWRGDQIARICRLASRRRWQKPQVEQVELNLFNRLKFEWDTRPVARRQGMGLVTFSPLASGMLTGKYDAEIPPDSRLERLGHGQNFTQLHRQKSLQFKGLAEELGCSRAQLAIAWTLAQPAVSSVITGASRLQQLEENLGALKIEISPELGARLQRLFAPGAKRILRYKAGRYLRAIRDGLAG